MQIHIGNLIRDELRRQGRTNDWFADQIGVNIRTVNKIFLKQTIDTSQLYQISKALDTDFFSAYSNILSTLPNKGKLPLLGRVNTK